MDKRVKTGEALARTFQKYCFSPWSQDNNPVMPGKS